ncbi:MAG TPA: hypothetical protein VEK31_10490 [Xanthobacteraceae bacterium]|nr:hypothetical protein [Xanthobacteraceae bacterium]
MVGSLEAMGKYLIPGIPGTPFGGAHTPAEIRTVAAGLKKRHIHQPGRLSPRLPPTP